jgi:hypothetical protein
VNQIGCIEMKFFEIIIMQSPSKMYSCIMADLPISLVAIGPVVSEEKIKM